MHVVNPHWVSGTRRRCQAIAVLISLQLCLISSVEANHRTVGELGSPDTGAVEPTWRRAATTSCTFPSLSLSLSLWRLFISRDYFFSLPSDAPPEHASCWELRAAAKLIPVFPATRNFPAVPLWAPLISWWSVIQRTCFFFSSLSLLELWFTTFPRVPFNNNRFFPETCSGSCCRLRL